MNAGVAEALGDGDHLGSALDASGLALILSLELLVELSHELVADVSASDAARTHEACGAAREQEDVGDDGGVIAALVAIADELVHLAGIVTKLVDEELGATDDLLFHLQVLRDGLTLEILEGVDNSTVEEVRGLLLDVALATGDHQALVHLGAEHAHMHGIEVVDRTSTSVPTADLIVTCHDQQVLDALALQAVQLRDNLIARAVLACKVNERNDALVQELLAERVGQKCRVATRVVRNGHRVNATRLVDAPGFGEFLFLTVLMSTASGNNLARYDELAALESVLESVFHQITPFNQLL